MRLALEDQGFIVFEAEDGQAAVASAERDTPDVILMDLTLPRMDGFAAAKLMREKRELQNVPIIAVTAHQETGFRTDAKESGFDAYVTKPIDINSLKELGAILMGAFTGGRMVGFVFGFPGILNGETIIHSDMLGVRPEYRSQSLGYMLKLAQRDAALALGVKRITWTFDPLQSRNAHLNFGKLGVTADRYLINYYGETSSFLHQSGTDRLWVTWQLDRQRVENPQLSNSFALIRIGPNGEPV